MFFWTLWVFTEMDVGKMAFNLFFSLALNVWLIYNVDNRNNWARIALLVYSILNMVVYIPALVRAFSFSVVYDGLSLSKIVLQLISLALLFGRDANLWFCPVEADPNLIPDDANRKA